MAAVNESSVALANQDSNVAGGIADSGVQPQAKKGGAKRKKRKKNKEPAANDPGTEDHSSLVAN